MFIAVEFMQRYYADTQGKGLSAEVSLGEFIGLCSALAERSVIESLAIAGEVKLSGTLGELTGVEDIFRVCKNAGAKKEQQGRARG